MTLLAATAAALTRAVLLIYPRRFRHEMGPSMVADVRRRAVEIGASRGAIALALWLVTLGWSLVINALAARAEGRRQRLSFSISWLDLKLALRMLVKYPGLALTGGLGIAVAIATVVGFFSVTQWRFHPRIPLDEGHRLVGLENWDRRTHKEDRKSMHDFVAWRAEMKSVQDMSAFRTVPRNAIAADGTVERVAVAEITPSGFRLARVPPLLGRALDDADAAPGAPPVVVIGFDVWRNRFESRHDIVGRDLRLGSTIHTVVGVMPEGFAFPVNHRFWTPLRVDAASAATDEREIYISARLAPGFDLDTAQAELTVIGDRMAAQFPGTHKHLRPEVLAYTSPFEGRGRDSSDDLVLINVLFALPLIVVCANVAILIYARTAARLGEIAVRTALGASRTRIVAQLFAESLVLAALAAGAGVMTVKIALEWMTRNHRDAPFWVDYHLTGTSIAYGAALTLVAAVITGILPALQATGRRLQTNLCHFNYGAALRLGRTWTALIVVQVSLAVATVPIVAALGWSQIHKLVSTPTFAVDEYLAGVLAPESLDGLPRLRAELSRRIDAEPGFADHAYVRDLPGAEREARVAIELDTSRGAPSGHGTLATAVDAGFFKVVGTGMLTGRPFAVSDQDEHAADVVIVNRAFRDRLVAGGDVLGRRVRYGSGEQNGAATPRWFEIVGVVENVETNPFAARFIEPRVYHPLKATEWRGASVLLRVRGIDHAAAATRLRALAAGVDPTLTVDTIPLREIYRLRRTVLNSAAVGIGAAVSSVLLLSAAGIYALMSFTVAQRRREIAIRLALGAQAGQLLSGVFRRALRQIALGVAAGIGLALLVDRSAHGDALLGYGVPLLTATVIVMSVVGLCAALGPARRGLEIDPSAALKAE